MSDKNVKKKPEPLKAYPFKQSQLPVTQSASSAPKPTGPTRRSPSPVTLRMSPVQDFGSSRDFRWKSFKIP